MGDTGGPVTWVTLDRVDGLYGIRLASNQSQMISACVNDTKGQGPEDYAPLAVVEAGLQKGTPLSLRITLHANYPPRRLGTMPKDVLRTAP
jgi:hypothetical protein